LLMLQFSHCVLHFILCLTHIRAVIDQSVQRLTTVWIIGVRFLAGVGNFLFAITSRIVLGPTQLPLQGVTMDSFPGHEAAGPGRWSLASGVEVKNTWMHTATPIYVIVAWYLVKSRESVALYLAWYTQVFSEGRCKWTVH
jgi:hypothetical protein